MPIEISARYTNVYGEEIERGCEKFEGKKAAKEKKKGVSGIFCNKK